MSQQKIASVIIPLLISSFSIARDDYSFPPPRCICSSLMRTSQMSSSSTTICPLVVRNVQATFMTENWDLLTCRKMSQTQTELQHSQQYLSMIWVLTTYLLQLFHEDLELRCQAGRMIEDSDYHHNRWHRHVWKLELTLS